MGELGFGVKIRGPIGELGSFSVRNEGGWKVEDTAHRDFHSAVKSIVPVTMDSEQDGAED